MYSIEMVHAIKEYCECYRIAVDYDTTACKQFCEFVAECDAIRNTYGAVPADVNIGGVD